MKKSLFYVLLINVLIVTVTAKGMIRTETGSLFFEPRMYSYFNSPFIVNPSTEPGIVSLSVNGSVSSSDAGFYLQVDRDNRYFFYLDNSRADSFRVYDYINSMDFIYYRPTGDFILSSPGHLYLNPTHDVRPIYPNQHDLGSSSRYWKNIYTNNLYYKGQLLTFSKGYSGSRKRALDAVTAIKTKEDDEIDHSTIDESLTGPDGSISVNSVIFANSKAISYLQDKIEKLEEENYYLKEKIKNISNS